MRNNIWTVLLVFLLLPWMNDIQAAQRKKKETSATKKVSTPYEKLFKGKKYNTADGGLMTLRLMNGKVYAELPLNLLGKDMMFTSSIQEISDNGEGVVGQFAGIPLLLRFVKQDSVVQVRTMIGNGFVDNIRGNMKSAVMEANAGGIYKLFKVLAVTPDSSAVVLDLTNLYLENSNYTNPFSAYAGNSMFGYVRRVHKFKKERSLLKGIKSYDNNVVVQCELGYDVDHMIFGNLYMYRDLPVTIVVNKMLAVLPEEPMKPRLADSRIGVQPLEKAFVPDGKSGIKSVFYAKRWRIEPGDEAKYRQGILVEPKKPIVFYMDSLMPQGWKKYIRMGAEEWNLAFEEIGFKNVIRVLDFPKDDPDFDAKNINNSTIMYSPLWLYTPQTSMCVDPRTGEILNASLYIHANTVMSLFELRALATMGNDPKARVSILSEEEQGELLRTQVMQYIGKCIGLGSNFGASYAYPVDSLRSPSFTRKYGLTPSIMDDLVCNFIAQPEDVERGVRLTPKGIGPYDYYAIKWLYQPIADSRNPEDEYPTLDRWIKESEQEPMCRYGKAQYFFALYDPSSMYYDLGDDHIKANRYFVENSKRAFRNFMTWYADGDDSQDQRKLMYDDMIYTFSRRNWNITCYIGGFYTREIAAGDHQPTYVPVPKSKQKEALNYMFELAEDLSWLDNEEITRSLPLRDETSEHVQRGIFDDVLTRLDNVVLCAQKMTDDAYTPEEFMTDIYDQVWKKAKPGCALSDLEMSFQKSFLATLIKSSTTTASATTFQETSRRALALNDAADKKFLSLKHYAAERDLPLSDYDMSRVEELSFGKEEVSGYGSLLVQVTSTPSMAPFYYDLLARTQNLLKRMVQTTSGDTKMHYEYLLFMVNKALSDK